MTASLELIVATFRTGGEASQVLRELRRLNRKNLIDVLNAVARLIVAAFRGQGRASKVLRELQELDEQNVVDVLNGAVLVKDRRSEVFIQETGDRGASRGRWFGAVAGGMIGAIGGPAGVVVGIVAGEVIGGAVVGRTDAVFIGAELENLLSSLPPRSSAVVALVERGCGEAVINAVDRYDAEVRRFGVQLDLTDELHSGRDWPLEGGTVR